jgi:alpha-tubulin suppressor-like RCC1 family protein
MRLSLVSGADVRRWLVRGLLVVPLAAMAGAALTWSSACAPGPYNCTSDLECVNGSGTQGECQSTGFCAYADTTCQTTNQRYSASAGGGLANACVPAPSASTACISQIAVGQDWSCYLRNDGTVWCWGSNSNGMIGQAPSGTNCPGNDELGPLPCIPQPTQIQGLPANNPIVQIRVAEYHACAMATDQTVWCWGFNDQTNLGQCQSATQLVQSQWPLQIFYPDPPKVSMPGDGADGGKGDNSDGGTTVTWASAPSTNPHSPTGRTCPGAPLKILPPNSGDYKSTFTVGGEHTCVIDTSGKLMCWGENLTAPVGGQAGQDFHVFLSLEGPLEVNGSAALGTQSEIISVSSGDDWTALLTAAGRVYGWGGNQDGELTSLLVSGGVNLNSACTSDGTTPVPDCTWSSSPTNIPFSSGAVGSLAIDDETGCALVEGALYCWGNGTTGLMQSNTLMNAFYPTPLSTEGTILYGGVNAETMFISSGGAISCWGANNFGQCASAIGNPMNTAGGTNIIKPTQSLISSVVQLEVGVDHGCALTTDGELYCWGDNSYGELGQGTTSTTPTYIPQKVKVACP